MEILELSYMIYNDVIVRKGKINSNWFTCLGKILLLLKSLRVFPLA